MKARELAKLRRIAGQTLAALLITKEDAFDRLRSQREMLGSLDDTQLLKLRQLLEGLIDAVDSGEEEQWQRVEQAWQHLHSEEAAAQPEPPEALKQPEPSEALKQPEQPEQPGQLEQPEPPEPLRQPEPQNRPERPSLNKAESEQSTTAKVSELPRGLFDEDTRTSVADNLVLDTAKTLSEIDQLNEDETTTDAAKATSTARVSDPDATGSLPNFPYALANLPPLSNKVLTADEDEQTQSLGLDEDGVYRPRLDTPPPSEVTMTFRQAGVGEYGRYDDDATSTLGFTSEAHPLALSVDEYAALCAERDNRPNKRRVIEMRYEINTDACSEAVDRFFELRFGQDPSMRSDWQQAYFRYTAMLKRLSATR